MRNIPVEIIQLFLIKTLAFKERSNCEILYYKVCTKHTLRVKEIFTSTFIIHTLHTTRCVTKLLNMPV